jgi:hypothetical protein
MAVDLVLGAPYRGGKREEERERERETGGGNGEEGDCRKGFDTPKEADARSDVRTALPGGASRCLHLCM